MSPSLAGQLSSLDVGSEEACQYKTLQLLVVDSDASKENWGLGHVYKAETVYTVSAVIMLAIEVNYDIEWRLNMNYKIIYKYTQNLPGIYSRVSIERKQLCYIRLLH